MDALILLLAHSQVDSELDIRNKPYQFHFFRQSRYQFPFLFFFQGIGNTIVIFKQILFHHWPSPKLFCIWGKKPKRIIIFYINPPYNGHFTWKARVETGI